MNNGSRALILGLCFAALLLTAAAQRQEGEPEAILLTLQPAQVETPLDFGARVVDAEAEFLIDLDPQSVFSDPAVLTLELYRGTELEARRVRSRQYDGWMSWSGELYFPEILGQETPAGSILLVHREGRVTGTVGVLATREDFQILASETGEHRLVRMMRQRRASCGVPDLSLEASAAQPPGGGQGSLLDFGPAGEGFAMLSGQTTAEIDVLALVIYGQDWQDAEDFILASVAVANNAFAFSDVDAEYNLIGPYEISSSDCSMHGCQNVTKVADYLEWMNEGSGKSYIEGLRSTYSADMVALFVQSNISDPCAIGNLPYMNEHEEIKYVGGTNQEALSWTDEAYSVNAIDCGLNDLTFAHELGHNFGLRHHDDPFEVEPIDPEENPKGHIFWTAFGQRATVMGCLGGTGDPYDEVCNRLHYFSDPNITVPMYGMEPTGSYEDRAAVAESLRMRVDEYELFR